MMWPKKFLARGKIIAVLAAVVLVSVGLGNLIEESVGDWYQGNKQKIEVWGDWLWSGREPEVAGDRDEVKEKSYVVTEVIDGDTIKIRMEDKVESVRLLGIDAPEMNDKNVKQACFARLAKEKLAEKLKDRRVSLEVDPLQGDRDRYQRLLRDVYVIEESDEVVWINGWLVREGLAGYYERYPVKNSETLRQYELEAKNDYKNLWSGRCL